MISVLLLHQEYEEEKWDWDQEWAVLRFMAPGPSHKVYNKAKGNKLLGKLFWREKNGNHFTDYIVWDNLVVID